MKKRGNSIILLIVVMLFVLSPALTSCGSLHSYWGVENDYYSGDDYRRPPKKHKKHKKKHKKHKKHRDRDDWDDD